MVGSAANEVCWLKNLCKGLGEPLLVSEAFAELLPLEWRALGRFNLKGVEAEQTVFAPPQD